MSATDHTTSPATQTYDRHTALLVVDVQNDFADPAGGLHIPGGEQVVEVANREIEAATAAGAPVFLTQDWHPESTPHFAKDGGTWPVHCVQGTWGAELHPDLRVPEEARVVRKGVEGGDGYSGFSVRDPVSGEESATELGRLLEEAGVRRVVVIGLAGDVCVRATALDARGLDYETVVPLTATRMVEQSPSDGERTVTELRDAGVSVVG